jgi:hypothetical protein
MKNQPVIPIDGHLKKPRYSATRVDFIINGSPAIKVEWTRCFFIITAYDMILVYSY